MFCCFNHGEFLSFLGFVSILDVPNLCQLIQDVQQARGFEPFQVAPNLNPVHLMWKQQLDVHPPFPTENHRFWPILTSSIQKNGEMYPEAPGSHLKLLYDILTGKSAILGLKRDNIIYPQKAIYMGRTMINYWTLSCSLNLQVIRQSSR